MLGKLFNLGTVGAVTGTSPTAAAGGSYHAAAGGTTRASPEVVLSLDSVQEDLHTRSLLYPDAQSLLPNRHHDQLFALPDSPRLPPATAAGLASAFDLDPDIDLDARDVRVLVMQDGIGSASSCLLYDSHPRPPTPPPTSPNPLSAVFAPPPAPNRPHTVGGGNLSHLSHALQDSPARRMVPPPPQRKPSLSHAARPVPIQPDSPQQRQPSQTTAEGRPYNTQQTHTRNPSRTHTRSQSRQPDPEGQRAAREYADEIGIFSSCIFGTSELLAYRGTSTKVHVLPSDARQTDPFAPGSLPYAMQDGGRGSLGRSSMRSSKLSQSFSSESAMFPPPPNSSSSSLGTSASSRQADRKRVLITRLFPVPMPADDESSSYGTTPMMGSPFNRPSCDGGSGAAEFPFPADGYSDGTPKGGKKKPRLKQKRTPMYAIALIVSLPQPPPPPPPPLSAAMRRSSSSRSAYPGPSSYPDHHQDQLSSSYGSAQRTGWTLQNGSGHDMAPSEPTLLGSPAFGATTDLEERMDPVTQHWDVIMRALTEMQAHVSATILSLLRAMDMASPSPQPWPATSSVRRTTSAARRRGEDGMGPAKPSKTNATLLSLTPNALATVNSVAADADRTRARVATGLRALRVVTGQNRWGIWREEARWVSQRTASAPLPDRELFLQNLLTAFLATHTDWLRALGPADARHRHTLQDASRGSDDALPARTIVVARDKTAARRIVFLLAAFLPAAPGVPGGGGARARRPSTAMSWAGGLSQSPPVSSAMPAGGLRRKTNSRYGPSASSGRRSSHLRNLSLQEPSGNAGGDAGGGAGLLRTASMSAAGVPPPLAHLRERRGGGGGYQHDRRPSDAGSIRTAQLPFSGVGDLSTRKSSAALTSTVASDATVPYFATLQRSTSTMSASSAAADDLKRTLLRVDSNSSTAGGPLSPLALQQQQARGGGRMPAGADARNDSPRWSGLLSGFLGGGRRREAPVGNGGNGSTSSPWDPLGLRRNSDAVPPSPGYPPHLRSQYGSGSLASREGEDTTRKATGAAQTSGGPSDAVPAHKSSDGDSPRTPQLGPNSPCLDDGRAGPPPSGSGFRPIPGASSAFDSPVRATADAEDGAIEVDILFPDHIQSFETAVSSPSTSGFLSMVGGSNGFGSGQDAFEQSCRVPVDGGLPANVAGWLPSYHRDFCLQAVPPQEHLLDQIKASLREEPSPAAHNAFAGETCAADRWVDVASAVVVDAGGRTVTRVQYSRRLRPKARADASLVPPSGYGASGPHLQPETLELEQLEERFVEEPVVAADGVLAHAVSRVLAQAVVAGGGPRLARWTSSNSNGNGNSGKTSSSSRAASVQRGRRSRRESRSSATSPEDESGALQPTPVGIEGVSRGACKTVLLSALEEVVRDVVCDVVRGREGSVTPGDEDEDGAAAARSVLQRAVEGWLGEAYAGT